MSFIIANLIHTFYMESHEIRNRNNFLEEEMTKIL